VIGKSRFTPKTGFLFHAESQMGGDEREEEEPRRRRNRDQKVR
jgi:hypothetical protein